MRVPHWGVRLIPTNHTEMGKPRHYRMVMALFAFVAAAFILSACGQQASRHLPARAGSNT